MYKTKQLVQPRKFGLFLFEMSIFLILSTPAFADLTSNVQDLQSKISAICTPLAIIFLIIAGWQKAMGNSQIFVLAAK